MTDLYPDEIEMLEMQMMNNYEPEPIYDNVLYAKAEQAEEQSDLPEPSLEIEPVPDYSDSIESESNEQNDSIIQLETALDKQAPMIDADFLLDELFPSTIAKVISKSCIRSQVDPIALSMMLIAATGSLLGSKVRVHTQVDSDPLASNLYVWLVGDSSSKKGRISKKITNPMRGVKNRETAFMKKAISNIKKKNSNPEQKREEIDSIIKNQKLEYCPGQDMSEQGINRLVAKQAPLQGLHMHLDEASDLFNGLDRYSGNRGGSSNAKTGQFRNLLLTGWVEPLRGSGVKADEERCIDFEEQTLTITTNIQQQYLTQILDIEEDSKGDAARHDVVLVRKSPEPDTRESRGIDPTSDFMLDRLIPFCKSIRIDQSKDTDDTGNRIRYNVCEFSDEAQEIYDEYRKDIMQKAEDNARQEIEPAFNYYLLKVGIRLAKLALIQHTFEALEGAKKDTSGFDFDPDIHFSNANTRINSPISKQAMQRAINWCNTLCKQRQLVIDSTRSAPMKREAQLLLGEKQQKMAHVLDKLKNRWLEYGPQSRSKFIANTKGTRNMGRSEVGDIIDTLIKRGCIEQTKEGRVLVLVWLKSLREARC